MSLLNCALMRYLQSRSTLLHGKAEELAISIRGWLAYVPNTFPHYTRHTVEHSEKIVSQLSKLLFHDDDPSKPEIALSSVEAYILVASALLHDSGMVVADAEKIEILRSGDWTDWLTHSDREGRLREIERIRKKESDQAIVANFVADVQLRFLIAEFVRARHHVRSGQFLAQNQSALGRFALDDPVLMRTIGDICVGHGLDRFELTDDFRFPLERDVYDEKVNVRLMAILLRLGDLLDMDSDRACPLLLSAASPLPANSVAHWTQYKKITHRSTTAERIEIFAECQTQDEHRVLRDWCDWIESEVIAAPRLLSVMRRHGGWRPPLATVGQNGTIRIAPAPSATYIPSDWRLHLDPIAVLDRLINDTYSDNLAFIRELLQNAIDATRCQLFQDLELTGVPWPERPEELDASVLSRYAILIKVRKVPATDALTGATDLVDEISIEDVGTGMTVEIIEGYFLQVGRSYYQSGDFKRRFPFSSIGRFGVGFLSVFGASEYVVVDTTAEVEGAKAQTRITLTGPRAYLLRERGQRGKRGTSVSVRLKHSLSVESLVDKVRGWCKRVEFPIHIDIFGQRVVITREISDNFVGNRAHVSDPQISFVVRALPFDSGAARGELYVFEEVGPAGVRWDRARWAKYEYARSHPYALVPPLPGIVACENGIDYSDAVESTPYGGASVRMDYRGPTKHRTMERSDRAQRVGFELKGLFESFPEVSNAVRSYVAEHLATSGGYSSADRWTYCQRLMDVFPVQDYWRTLPGTVQVFWDGVRNYVSLAELLEREVVWTSVSASWSRRYISDPESVRLARARREERAATVCPGMALVRADLYELSDISRHWLFGSYHIDECRLSEGDVLLAAWRRGTPDSDRFVEFRAKRVFLIEMPSVKQVGFEIPSIGLQSYSDTIILNTSHPLVRWWAAVRRSAIADPTVVPPAAITASLELVVQPIGNPFPQYVAQLHAYLNGWRNSTRTPDDLRPPANPEEFEFVVDVPPETHTSVL